MPLLQDMPFTAWVYLALGSLLIGMAKNGIPGVGILVVPCVVAAFPARQAMGVLLPMLIAGDILAVRNYHPHAAWNIIKRLSLPIGAGVVAGWIVLNRLNDEQLESWLGVILISLVILQFFKGRACVERLTEHLTAAILIGFLIGFSSTLANLAGPILGIYLITLKQEKTVLVATSALLFFLLNLVKVPVYILQEMITVETLTVSLCAVPVIFLGAMAGVTLHKRIPQGLFNGLIIAVAILAAVLLILG